MGKDYSLQGQDAPGYRTRAPKAGQLPADAAPGRMSVSDYPGTASAENGPKGAAGLSKPHIGTGEPYQPPKPSITFYRGASLVDVNVPRTRPVQADRETKPRGKIKEWSGDSRGRLKRFLGTLKREELKRALVVTLTYPNEFPAPDDHEVYKYHLKKFGTYLERRWAQCSAIWKLEFQSRGAAHYHLMVYGLHGEELETVRTWVRETWYRIAHNGDKHLGAAGTQVDPIRSIGGAVSYLVKYLSKGDQTMPGNFGGRYWGKLNEEWLPIVQPEILLLSEKQAIQVRRIARKKMQKDVESSRWKRFLEKENEQFWRVGGRAFWECLKSTRHGSKRKFDADGDYRPQCLKWMFKDGRSVEIDGNNYVPLDEWQFVPYSVEIIRRDLRQLPKRWKARNNDRVRIMCDASAFMECLKRMDKPASSFLEWSRQV